MEVPTSNTSPTPQKVPPKRVRSVKADSLAGPKKRAAGTTGKTAAAAPSSEALNGMIATAAYYLAAARGFTPGNELEDWLEAEKRITALYS